MPILSPSWKPAGFVLATLFLGLSPAQASDLDRFLSGFERCAPSPDLVRLGAILRDRTSFENKDRERRSGAGLPRVDGVSFGSVTATDGGRHTKVRLAVTGSFRSLPVTAIEFHLGHSNGINVTTLAFHAAESEVLSRIGPTVLEAMEALRRDEEMRDFGFSAKIVPGRGQTLLVVDCST